MKVGNYSLVILKYLLEVNL